MLLRWARIAYAADGAEGGSPDVVETAPADAAPATEPAGDQGGTSLLTEAPPAETPADAKPEAAPEPIDPASYEVKLPEGLDRDDDLLTSFLEGAAKGGMDNESVQAVLDSLAPKLAERLAGPSKAWADLNGEWQKEVRGMPDIGGDKLPGTVSAISRAFDQVCTGYTRADGTEVSAKQEQADLKAALDLTGAGNNPAIVRAMHRFAVRLMEPGADGRPGAVTGSAVPNQPSTAARMYPSASDGVKS